MDRENQAVVAVIAAQAALDAAECAARSAAEGTAVGAGGGAPAGGAAGAARPGKEQVRRWLVQRVSSRQPLPEPDAIRRAIGWLAADQQAAPARQTPEAPAAA
jgi:hypothetical protein